MICVFGASLALPQAPKTPAPKTPPKAASKAAPKATAKKTTGTKKTYKTAAKKAGPPAQTWRNRQLAPTPARYKEIQKALADQGYLKTEPNGVWDANSEEAMKLFQTERNLPPSGKVNAPSLIGLGLGPKAPDPITTPPNATTPNATTPGPTAPNPIPNPPNQ